jgi:hypothetical protein
MRRRYLGEHAMVRGDRQPDDAPALDLSAMRLL